MRDNWDANMFSEIEFWDQIMGDTFPNKEWCDGFKETMKGINTAPAHTHQFLKSGIKILDVGSGPGTTLGGVFNDIRLDLTAVDPLAHEYEKLYKKYNLWPLTIPIYGEAENLSSVTNERYDFVYSQNALDHSYDPFKAIQSMINVCKLGGVVGINNEINEGLYQNYSGLHQWNFMPTDNDMIIWNKDGFAKILSKNLRSGSYRTIETQFLGGRSFFVIINL